MIKKEQNENKMKRNMKLKMKKLTVNQLEPVRVLPKIAELITIMTKNRNNNINNIPNNNSKAQPIVNTECEYSCECELHFRVCFSGLQVNVNNICDSCFVYFLRFAFRLWSAVRRPRLPLPLVTLWWIWIGVIHFFSPLQSNVQCPTLLARSPGRSLCFAGRGFN